VLKTTARSLPTWIAVAVGFFIALDLDGAGLRAEEPSPGSVGSTQNAADARSQADDLVRRARQAMAENDLDAAGVLITQAETLGAQYGPLHLGDTPQRARRDLERMLSPGGLFAPLTPGEKQYPPVDPFAAHNSQLPPAMAAGRSDQRVMPLPPVGDALPLAASSSPAQRAASNRFLLDARRALATGDVARADDMIRQARQAGASYGPLDDTPDKVASLLGRYGELIAQQASRGQTEGYRRQFAKIMMEQAEGLLRWREYGEAERLAETASRQGVMFGPFEANPAALMQDIRDARLQDRSGVVPAGGQYVTPATGSPGMDNRASRAVYDPSRDPTRNMLAAQFAEGGPTPADAMPPRPGPMSASRGEALFEQGQAALRNHETQKALDFFRQAAAFSNELDPITRQRLQDALQMLSASPHAGPQGPASSLLDDAAAKQQVLARQVMAEVAYQESNAERLRETDPKGALAVLEETRQNVAASGLEPTARDQLLRRLDRDLADTQRFIEENRPRIELDENNRRTREEIERGREMKLDLQDKISVMVKEYNRLVDEQNFDAAEVVAKRVKELDPQNPFAEQLVMNAKLLRRLDANAALRDNKERGFWDALTSVDDSGAPFDDRNPYVHGPIDRWEALTRSRSKMLSDSRRTRSEREMEIERKLKTPVLLQFNGTPLSQALDYLARLAEINLYLDPQGLAEEGITSDDPVTINFASDITLQNALSLILEEKHLAYVIKNDVLKVTSEQLVAGEVYTRTYNVADLVVPIPNFVPNPRMGLAGAYHDALGNVGFGGSPFGNSSAPLTVVASRDGGRSSGAVNPAVMAQISGSGGPAGTPGSGIGPMGFGPGGLGGGTMADFDSLIDLITTTIEPTSWDTVGGPGAISQFETNLSLVVSQTQEVHEQLVDLLEQLRRMQDLQVTIEVRFITLNDNFFERIGVDFDFDIDDDIDRPFQVFGRPIDGTGDPATGTDPTRNTLDTDHDNGSVTVGLQAPGVFSADLDIPFTQNNFGLAVPQFGGFDASAGAQLGFAILSDIEAFFFISAAQGDRRSNVMQAPKVTLFNGQQAMIADSSQSPFVISVIPVVGDFAAAQQPVIVVLNEGTFLTVQAVVSDDRRFVRLTVVPYFSAIGDVDTFTFEGTETTTEDSSQEGIQDVPNNLTRRRNARSVTRQGTTVQLPTFSYVTVTTTVSVPDGGTVLLGGIKRLSEGRNEFGVPMLNKLPYINRLFKNVGIGRETQSLMMMVTPRIIIQEEEEQKLGILPE
jgi:general secretion pathway protein D